MGEKFELVADIGGTNTRVGLSQNSKLMRQSIEKYPNANVKSLDEILIRYLSAQKLDTVSGVCVALAGPVRNDVAQMTNLSWEITKDSLARVTGAKTVGLLNDLQAQGYALDHLSDNQLLPVSGKRAVSSKDTKLVCGIGTGLMPARLFLLQMALWFLQLKRGTSACLLPINNKKKLLIC